jgi:hypothetical protein
MQAEMADMMMMRPDVFWMRRMVMQLVLLMPTTAAEVEARMRPVNIHMTTRTSRQLHQEVKALILAVGSLEDKLKT